MDIITLAMAKAYSDKKGGASSWNDLQDKPFEATLDGWKTAVSANHNFVSVPTNNNWNISVQLSNFTMIEGNQYKILLKEPVAQRVVLETVCTGRIDPNPVVGGMKSHYLGSADDPIRGYSMGGGINWSFSFTATHPAPTMMNIWIVEIQEVEETIKPLDQKFLPESVVTQKKLDAYLNEMFESGAFSLIKSSTENSTKTFRLTVDDNGTISATEV